jgi:lycopene cyclase domain-containing protein
MDSLRYLLILAACLGLVLPLEFALRARVLRRPGRLLATLAPVFAVFITWDLIAVASGHWSYQARYVLGPRLLGLPVEEWFFFIVVPVCALLTFEAVARVPERDRADRGRM